MSKQAVIAAAIALLVGLVGGYFAGRYKLENEWKQPVMLVAPDSTSRRAAADQELAPPAGSRILRPMPLERTRLAARSFTEKDPLLVTVGDVGRGDEGDELHLTIKNRGKCAVSAYGGVAYGFDAWGNPSPLNITGDHYIGFGNAAPIEPGADYQHSTKLKGSTVVNLVVAHVDSVQCADGSTWKRGTMLRSSPPAAAPWRGGGRFQRESPPRLSPSADANAAERGPGG